MWCWRRMEKISNTDCVRNEEVLQRVKIYRNILHTVNRRKASWVGHVLSKICLLIHVTEYRGKDRSDGGRKRKQLPDDLKEKAGYWKLKEEALDCTGWRTGCGPVVRQTAG
jgi:hypothetical protein